MISTTTQNYLVKLSQYGLKFLMNNTKMTHLKISTKLFTKINKFIITPLLFYCLFSIFMLINHFRTNTL